VVDRRVALLAGGAFVVATDATLVVGLLQQIARTLSVSPAAAGQAVTVYAAAYALAAPVVIRAARRARPGRLLAGTLGLFALANAATGAAISLVILLAARFMAGASAGVFMACAAAAAGGSVPARRRGRALATVVAGASLATALGVPLGTFAGAIAGWRAVFFGLAAATALAATASWHSPYLASAARSAGREGPRGRVLVILAATLLWATGSFTCFTYIGVVLRHTAAVGPKSLAAFLLLFGTAGLAGAAVSGWLTDRKGPVLALSCGLTMTALSLAGLGLTATLAARPALAFSIVAIISYGLGTWAVTPPQQQRLLAEGDDRLLLSLNASALYLGVALGGLTGGITLALSHSISAVCWAAASIELAALALVASRRHART
jgi:DHA1 family inner membrane transport protein